MKPLADQWYVAVLIVKLGVSGFLEKRPLFDRQFKLLRAASPQKAYQKALKLGKQECFFYLNPDGRRVTWRFVGIADLKKVDSGNVYDSGEIYSIVLRGNPEREVRRKDELAVFRYESTKHKPLKSTTSKKDMQYAPAAALRWVGQQIKRRSEREAKAK